MAPSHRNTPTFISSLTYGALASSFHQFRKSSQFSDTTNFKNVTTHKLTIPPKVPNSHTTICPLLSTAFPRRRPRSPQSSPLPQSFSPRPYRRHTTTHSNTIPSTHLLPPSKSTSNSSQTVLRLGPFQVRVAPRIILCFVPVLWASFVICAKLLYMIPMALPPAIFNTLRLLVSCMFFSPILFTEVRSLSNQPRSHFRHIVPGLQLGLLVFTANILQILGLRYAPAGRSAFLNQLSTIFIPLAAAALRIEPLTKRIVAGALIALSGIFLLTAPVRQRTLPMNPPQAVATTTIDSKTVLSKEATSETSTREGSSKVKDEKGASALGDGLQLSSAAFTTAYVLRVSHFARHLPAVRYAPLSAVKVCTQTGLSILWLAGTNAWKYYNQHPHRQVTKIHAVQPDSVSQSSDTRRADVDSNKSNVQSEDKSRHQSPLFMAIVVNGLLVLWAGVMVSALSAYLQTEGQAGVSAGEAAVLFASQPVWASIFAFLLLNERMQASGMMGAGLIVVGAVLASVGRGESKECSEKEAISR